MTTEAGLAEPLLALLRGEPNALVALDGTPMEVIEEAASREGIAPLIAELAARVSGQSAGARLADALGGHARRESLKDIVRQHHLRILLDAFGAAAIPMIVFKGEHLAHLCYDRSDLRPRLDTDVLVRPQDRSRAASLLAACGYHPVPQLEASLISYQTTYVKGSAAAEAPVLDVHWRVHNPQEFGDVLSVDELFENSTPIPALGPHARGPRLFHALVLSLLHPIAHHAGRDRLLWDFDSAQLISRMSHPEWADFLRLAKARRISGLLEVRLDRVRRMFELCLPDEVTATLREQGRDDGSRRQSHGRSRAGVIFASLRSLPRWTDRTTMLRQHVLPPRDYMRHVYAPDSRVPIAVLYVRRALAGAFRYWRR